MFTPNIALETSSHLRNNNIGRMMQCAAVYTSRRLSAMSGSSRKCMRLQGSKMVWWEFYTLPPHSYAEYWGRFTLGARAARHHPADRAAQSGRQRAMAARVPLKLARGRPHLTGGCSHATCQPARPLLDLPPRFTLGARAARHHPADRAAQNGRHAARNTRRKYVVGVCRIPATPFWSRASACTCD